MSSSLGPLPQAQPTLSQGQGPGDGGVAGVNTVSSGASPSPARWGFRKLRSASEPAEPYLLPVILAGREEPYSQ